MNKLVQRIEALEGVGGSATPTVIMFRILDVDGGTQALVIEGPDGHKVTREPGENEDDFECRAVSVFQQRTGDTERRVLTLIADCGHFDAAPRSEGKRHALEIGAPWLDVRQIRSRN